MALTDEQIKEMYEGADEEKLVSAIDAYYKCEAVEKSRVLNEINNLAKDVGIDEFDGHESSDHFVERVIQDLSMKRIELRFNSIKNSVNGDGVHFSSDDKAVLQEKLNELRECISAVGVESSHRERILKKLNELQAEIDKETTNYQMFLGVLTDLGLSLGSFGENAKPAVDRLKELMTFSIHIKVEQEQLPFSPKMPLPDDSIREETKNESDDEDGPCRK